MGLKKLSPRTENKNKFEFPNAYVKIDKYQIDSGNVNVTVKFFGDQEARNLATASSQTGLNPWDNQAPILEKSYSFRPETIPAATLKTKNEADRFIHCLYLALAQHLDFSGSTSVFETGQNVPL